MLTRTFFVSAVIALSGCAADVAMPDARKSVQTVRLDGVKVPPKPTVINPTMVVGGGLVGAVASLAGTAHDAATNPGGTLLQSGIGANRIGEVARQDFISHFSAVKAFPAIAQGNADATLEIEITEYGLYPAVSVNPTKKRFRALVRLNGKMTRADGKVIWSSRVYAAADDKHPEFMEFLESPSMTREQFRRAAELAILQLLDNLDTSMSYGAADALADRRKAVEERIARYEEDQKARTSAVLAAFAAPAGLPREGDTWTYRLVELERGRDPKRRKYVVKAASVSATEIRDELLIDDQPVGATSHTGGGYLVRQGILLYSPYLPMLTAAAPRIGEGRVTIPDAECARGYSCSAHAQFVGYEEIATPAGTFDTIRIKVEYTWGPDQYQAGTARGSRALNVWYSPKVKRAVGVASIAGMGENSFALELDSYQVK